MYRSASPIFDVPEFPPLRRVKPLPKRRRTSEPDHVDDSGDRAPARDVQVPELTADELAKTLSTSMALQSYYMPIFSGVQDLFRDADVLDYNYAATDYYVNGNMNGNGNGDGAMTRGADGGGGRREEEEQGEGESYVDQMQQPGNTKKRKVPAANISPNGDALDGHEGAEEEPVDRSMATGARADVEPVEFALAPLAPPGTGAGTGAGAVRRGKTSAATQAGLQHKEMLRSRKRQLAAVLGALSHGDTLALDQALSSHYPFAKMGVVGGGGGGEGLLVRLSRRVSRRRARAAAGVPDGDENARIPECDFAFEWPSATSERVVATKEEVAMLHTRFEAELARQAAKAAESARQAALAINQMQQKSSKRGDRTQQRMRTAGVLNGGSNEQNAGLSDRSVVNVKAKGKKKRSALANASNPHHLRNYVPSRIPHSGPTGTNAGNNYLGPAPLRFLGAEIPARRKKTQRGSVTAGHMQQLTAPEDEWMCAFCEYSLFYGDEQSYRRAIRSRKKILSRRRRARERAAAAASGKKGVGAVEVGEREEEKGSVEVVVPSTKVVGRKGDSSSSSNR